MERCTTEQHTELDRSDDTGIQRQLGRSLDRADDLDEVTGGHAEMSARLPRMFPDATPQRRDGSGLRTPPACQAWDQGTGGAAYLLLAYAAIA